MLQHRQLYGVWTSYLAILLHVCVMCVYVIHCEATSIIPWHQRHVNKEGTDHHTHAPLAHARSQLNPNLSRMIAYGKREDMILIVA